MNRHSRTRLRGRPPPGGPAAGGGDPLRLGAATDAEEERMLFSDFDGRTAPPAAGERVRARLDGAVSPEPLPGSDDPSRPAGA